MSTILVIDDDLAILELFGRILERGGYSVRRASRSLDAMKILQDSPIDLVILDLNMPEPDGFAILKELRASMPGLRIVVVSGYLDGALLKAAELLGATLALAKREAPEMLLKIVRSVLEKRRKQSRESG